MANVRPASGDETELVLNQSGRTLLRRAVWTELHALLIRHQLLERSYHALRITS